MVKMKSATEATNAAITAAASAWNKTTETTSSRIKDITRNINTQDAKPPLQDSAVLARQRLQAVKTVFDHLELIGGQTETELIRVLSQVFSPILFIPCREILYSHFIILSRDSSLGGLKKMS